MTLEEVEATLPNGFHDAEVKRLAVDYRKPRVTIDACLWVAVEASPSEYYRDGELVIEGLQFLVIEPPDPSEPYAREYTSVDLWPTTSKRPKLPKLSADYFVSGFYVNEWNSSIWIGAREARLTWTGEAYDRRA